MITCGLKYEIVPERLDDFETYARRWMELVEAHGGQHHGYFLPHEGPNDLAYAFFSFPSLGDYEAYRTTSMNDSDCQAAYAIAVTTRCIRRYDRHFFRPLLGGPGFTAPGSNMTPRSSSRGLPNLDGREFRVVNADPASQTAPDTRFVYHQSGEAVWGEYSGGAIAIGRLVGTAHGGGQIELRYCHVDTAGTLCTGKCLTEVVGEPGLPLRLVERWQWTGGREGRGKSVLEEIMPPIDEPDHVPSSTRQRVDQA